MLSSSVLTKLSKCAQKSSSTHKHAACLLRRNAIVAISYNNGRQHAEEKVLKEFEEDKKINTCCCKVFK